MNIAVYHKGKIFGGIENQILNLIQELKSYNDIIFISDSISGLLNCRLENAGIQSHQVRGGLMKRAYQISKLSKQNHIKILTAHTFDASFDIRIAKLFYPKLRTIFRVHTYIACSWISSLKKKVYYAIDGICSFLIDKYIVNGQYLINEAVNHTIIPRIKIESVIDGIEQITTYNQLNCITNSNEAIRLLMIANVIPHKGHDTLIRGVAILRNKGHNVTCDVLGDINRDPQYYNSLLLLAKELHVEDKIKFLGFAYNKILTNYPVVVLPSDSEGTPNCIMEAMSVGRIVSVSSTGGVPEMIQDGENGFLHQPMDADSFAHSIERIISLSNNEVSSISNKAYQSWKQNFSSKVMAESIYKIMKQL